MSQPEYEIVENFLPWIFAIIVLFVLCLVHRLRRK